MLRVDHDGHVSLSTCSKCVPGPVETLAILDVVREHLLPMVGAGFEQEHGRSHA